MNKQIIDLWGDLNLALDKLIEKETLETKRILKEIRQELAMIEPCEEDD